jgi:hypothetical protein
MAERTPEHQGLPVAGYRPQSAEAVDLVNGFKADEERLLRALDAMADSGGEPRFDPRWLAIARTALEQGFMALIRAVFRPARIRLPGDEKPE